MDIEVAFLSLASASVIRIPVRDRDMARLRVVQRRELLDPSPADLLDDAFAQAAVQVADELGVRLGELAERAVQELDARATLRRAVAGLDRRLEAEPVELALERTQTAARAGTTTRFDTPGAARVGGVVGLGTDTLGERGQQPGEQCVRGRVEAEPGCPRCEEVEVLRATDGAAVHGLDVDEAGVPEPLEVEADRVGVDAERVGEVLRRERRRGAGELA